MKYLLLCIMALSFLTGCGTIQQADIQAGLSYRTDVRQRNMTIRATHESDNAVRLAAVQGASTVTVHPSGITSPCPALQAREEEFEKLCDNHTEGSGDVNTDREAVCVPLRAALDQLRDKCTQDAASRPAEVTFTPAGHSSAGININMTGASTGDIRFIIQSPGAADQSKNGATAQQPSPPPPESTIGGVSRNLLGFLGKVTPWATGGYVLNSFSDAFGDGMRNAGHRDNSVDQSTLIDQSIGGDKIDIPVVE